MKQNWFKMAVADNVLRIDVYSEIGFWGINAEEFMSKINSNKFEHLELHINSMGGSVFEAVTIYNNLKALKQSTICYIDGICASAATVVALGCDKVVMPNNTFFMVHNPSVFTDGEAKDLRKNADFLDKIAESITNIYIEKTGMSKEDIKILMDGETWLNSEEANKYGFVDSIVEDIEIPSNKININLQKVVPAKVLMFFKQNIRLSDEVVLKNEGGKEKMEQKDVTNFQAENINLKSELDGLRKEIRDGKINLKIQNLTIGNKITTGQENIVRKIYETSENWDILDTYFETVENKIDETVNLTLAVDQKKEAGKKSSEMAEDDIDVKMIQYEKLLEKGFSEEKATKMAFGKILGK